VKYRGLLLILAALAACPWLPGVCDARNVALLVAVGQFRDPEMKEHELLGTAADIDSMQQALTGRWGFAAGDVVALRNQDATHERILAEISALEKRSAPGDTVLIYFSGHGTSANDEDSSFDLPYATGAWVPYDIDVNTVATAQSTLIIGRRDLVPRLKKLDQGGRLVVVISDSCYSGQVVRSFGQRFSHTRYLPMVTRDLGVARAPAPAVPSARPPPPPYPYQHVVLLSGASDSETGADISTPQLLQLAPTVDGKFHGAFTDAVLRMLDGSLSLNGKPLGGNFNYAQGRQALNDFLLHRNFAQHPQLLPALAEDPLDVGSTPFLGARLAAQSGGPPAAHDAPPAATVRDTTVHVRLETVSPALRTRIAALGGVTVVDKDGDLTLSQNGTQAQLKGPAGDPIVSTTASDPNLLRRIAAQAWLNRAIPAGTDSLGLRAETDPGSRGNTYVQCESFVFEVKLQKPAYVMLLDLDSQGDLTVLYPASASERQVIPSGAARAIPGADPKDHIVVTAPFGTDEVTVLGFEKQPGFFADLTGAQRFATDSPRADSLAKGLASATGVISVQKITVNTYPGKSNSFCGS
jgi:Caspase domain/Domain of unknown function (DUF4384)